MFFLQGRCYWKGKICEETLLDIWWYKVDYILSFVISIYGVLGKTNVTSLHLVIGIWNVRFSDGKSEKNHISIWKKGRKLRINLLWGSVLNINWLLD